MHRILFQEKCFFMKGINFVFCLEKQMNEETVGTKSFAAWMKSLPLNQGYVAGQWAISVSKFPNCRC